MAILIFRLNNVPEDEANEVRERLDSAKIDYYETSAGKWGFSMAGIWLKDESQHDEASALLAAYAQEREQAARAQYQKQLANGEIPSFWARVKAHPVLSLFIGIGIIIILYTSTIPFITFSSQ